MFYSRLFAGISFLGFALVTMGTIRLALAERGWPMVAGDARNLDDQRAVVHLNPRDSAAWMAIGLGAERDGDLEEASHSLLEAEKVDRQYLPAWTSANFFFRRADDHQFWRAAARAAAMSYDDPAPLIELADRREPNAGTALDRLGDSAHLERGYIRFLMGQRRWQEAGAVAARLSLRGEARDRELMFNLTDRLIEANEADAALAAWNGIQHFPALDRARHGRLVNQDFKGQPSGEGFDWRVTEAPRGSVRWEPSKLQFWLAGSTPEACKLVEQWVVLDAGCYCLRFKYRTEGLAAETGLRWTLLHRGREEASSAVLGLAPGRGPDPKVTEWSFRVAEAGLYQLAWVYRRVPGTTHQEGLAELAHVDLEAR